MHVQITKADVCRLILCVQMVQTSSKCTKYARNEKDILKGLGIMMPVDWNTHTHTHTHSSNTVQVCHTQHSSCATPITAQLCHTHHSTGVPHPSQYSCATPITVQVCHTHHSTVVPHLSQHRCATPNRGVHQYINGLDCSWRPTTLQSPVKTTGQ